MIRACAPAVLLLVAACDAPPTAPAPPAASPTAGAPAPSSIGTGRLRADGTIELRLVARGPRGMLGDGLLTYPPSHAQHATIKAHLESAHGPLVVDRDVPVPPFP